MNPHTVESFEPPRLLPPCHLLFQNIEYSDQVPQTATKRFRYISQPERIQIPQTKGVTGEITAWRKGVRDNYLRTSTFPNVNDIRTTSSSSFWAARASSIAITSSTPYIFLKISRISTSGFRSTPSMISRVQNSNVQGLNQVLSFEGGPWRNAQCCSLSHNKSSCSPR